MKEQVKDINLVKKDIKITVKYSINLIGVKGTSLKVLVEVSYHQLLISNLFKSKIRRTFQKLLNQKILYNPNNLGL